MLVNWSFLKIAKPEAILYQIIYIYLEKKSHRLIMPNNIARISSEDAAILSS